MPPFNLADVFFMDIRQTEEQAERVYGPVVGLVVDNKDPKQLARVQVKYPCLGGPDRTWWAPLAALGAGNDRGWFFLPEVNDEVLLLFEQGEIDRPVVVGAIWNGIDIPPDTNGGANERRSIVSRESSKIIFDDTKGAEKVIIEDGKGFGRITIDAANKKITLEAMQGDVCIQAPAGTLNAVCNTFSSSAQMNYHLETGSGGIAMSSPSATMGGKMFGVSSNTDINPGGVQDAQEAQASPEAVKDPLGGT